MLYIVLAEPKIAKYIPHIVFWFLFRFKMYSLLIRAFVTALPGRRPCQVGGFWGLMGQMRRMGRMR